MSVDLSWLANINVSISTTALSAPSFNNCMIAAVFPVASKPSGWGSALAYNYTSLAAITADFQGLYDAAVTASQFVQAYKYAILLKAAFKFFSQTPTPTSLVVSCIDNTSTINYVTALQNIVNSNNNWFAFYIADQTTASQLTASNGIYDAVVSQVTQNNPKICFLDSNDLNITSGHFFYDATNGGIGSSNVCLFGHTNNPVSTTVTTAASVVETLAASNLGEYFTNLFTGNVGVKTLALAQLAQTAADTAITKSALGSVGPSGSGLLNVNANVYPSIGGSGLMQYGLMSSSVPNTLVYLDQVVGATYIQLTVQTDLANYLIQKRAISQSVPYNDSGIQQLALVFKNSLQKAVNFGVIQQFSNSDITTVPYSQVSDADKSAKIYTGLSASLLFLGQIQRVQVGINISL